MENQKLLDKIAELEKKITATDYSEQILRQIIEKTGDKTGLDFLKSLTIQISTLLGFKYVLIGKLNRPDNDKIETLAFCCDGKIIDNTIYKLSGTPCDNVIGKTACFYPNNIQELFPNDHMLVDMGLKSYLGVPLIGSDGQPTGILVALHDQPRNDLPVFQSLLMSFTFRTLAEIERIEAIKSLETSKKLFKDFLDNASVISYIKDKNLRMVFISKEAENFLKIKEADLLGKKNEDYLPPEVAERITKNDLMVLEQKKPIEFEEVININKTIRTYIARKFPILDENGEAYLLGGVSIDITERKKAEMEMAAAKEEALRANEFKDKFVSLVAHDLRSPAAVISKLLKIICRDVENLLPEERLRQLRNISLSAEKLSHRLENIMDINRIKSGIANPRPRFINPAKMTAQILSDFEPMARKKHITLINNITEQKEIFTDGTLLEHVIFNLISNAIKFSRERGVVTIFMPPEKPLTFAISDQGIGINPETAKNIFDYVQKISHPGTAGETGTGFGLSLSSEIMKSLGGSLTFESVENEGSLFYVTLPLKQPKILIVDDDQLIRFDLSFILQKLNIEVIEAADGQEAWNKIKTDKPALILSDLTMPIMDGFELLDKLKTDPETENIPCIIITGHILKDLRKTALAKGAADLINKPISQEDLISRIKSLLW